MKSYFGNERCKLYFELEFTKTLSFRVYHKKHDKDFFGDADNSNVGQSSFSDKGKTSVIDNSATTSEGKSKATHGFVNDDSNGKLSKVRKRNSKTKRKVIEEGRNQSEIGENFVRQLSDMNNKRQILSPFSCLKRNQLTKPKKRRIKMKVQLTCLMCYVDQKQIKEKILSI
jgi:hypothetical protein